MPGIDDVAGLYGRPTCLSSPDSSTPDGRATGHMNDRKHLNALRVQLVIHHIRKTMHHDTPIVLMRGSERSGLGADALETSVHLLQKLRPDARLLRVVPAPSLSQILLCLGSQDEINHHRASIALGRSPTTRHRPGEVVPPQAVGRVHLCASLGLVRPQGIDTSRPTLLQSTAACQQSSIG